MSKTISPALAVVIAAVVSTAAAAQSICVDCKDPDRNYRCTIKDSERVQHVRGASRAIEFACLSEIARSGGHTSCRVNTAFQGPCIGQPYEIDVARAAADGVATGKPAEPAGGEASQATDAAPPATPAAPAVPAKKGPPQTLEELARETVAKSKEQISAADEKMRKAGDAVGDAVKKTWDCMTSLFNRC